MSTTTRLKTCAHCLAILSFDISDLFSPATGQKAFICPECGRTQEVKETLHINDEKNLLKKIS